MLRLSVIALLTTLVLAACGAAPAAPSGPGGTTGPTQPPVATAPPIGNPPPASLIPDQPLEDLFPDELGGQAVAVESATGQSVQSLFGDTDPAEMSQFLSAIGATIDQMSAAFAFHIVPGATQTDFSGVSILAFRVRGVPGSTVLTRFAELIREDSDDEAVIGSAVISGKTVTTVAEPDDDEDSVANLYAVGDVVFFIGGTPALVEEAFAKLP